MLTFSLFLSGIMGLFKTLMSNKIFQYVAGAVVVLAIAVFAWKSFYSSVEKSVDEKHGKALTVAVAANQEMAQTIQDQDKDAAQKAEDSIKNQEAKQEIAVKVEAAGTKYQRKYTQAESDKSKAITKLAKKALDPVKHAQALDKIEVTTRQTQAEAAIDSLWESYCAVSGEQGVKACKHNT